MASESYQPFLKPATRDEYERIKPQLVDSSGKPLESVFCSACGVKHFTVEPCLVAVRCPSCGSVAARCRRPSGHDTNWHADRVAELERVTRGRDAAGLPVVAPWPTPRPALFEMED